MAKQLKLRSITVRVYDDDVRFLKELAATQAASWHWLLRERLHAAVKQEMERTVR